ncbi:MULTISPECIES: hypothetical protein [unclassified Pseudomonas]|uniref:hypothetical protein n=1 Tax=unclassified Pseudomonas TaxID=196821 RepID=UPI00128B0FE6|nr:MULTISPECIES: hypothetical protein [unclassified Pseudomonas]MPQ69534.1 hypothetical protein [Pseudomonas sp. MWU12-2323]
MMNLHSIAEYFANAWQELAVGGAAGYALAGLKSLPAMIKSFVDYRKGKGRVKAEGKVIPGLEDKQSAARHNNRDGFGAGQLLECFEVRVRNIGAVPAFVEDVWLSDRNGSTYHAYKTAVWHTGLVRVGEGGAIEVAPGSYHDFLLRIPYEKDILELTHWCVSFNNGVIWKAHLLTWRQRLFRR